MNIKLTGSDVQVMHEAVDKARAADAAIRESVILLHTMCMSLDEISSRMRVPKKYVRHILHSHW